MKRRFVFEVIEDVQRTKIRQDKLNILHTNMCPALAGILRLNFDEEIQLDVDLDISYRPRKQLDEMESLNHSAKIWRTFTNQSSMAITRKNLRFKGMLESLEPREAEVFIQAAKRQLKLGLSKLTVSKCLPEVFGKK